MQPFLYLNVAFAMIFQHESLSGVDIHVDESPVSIHSVDGKISMKNTKGKFGYNSKSCTFDGKVGHNVDICYSKKVICGQLC